jgi:hypothetical protein
VLFATSEPILFVRYGWAPIAFLLASESSSSGRGMSMRDRPSNSPSEGRGDHNEGAHAVIPGKSHTQAKNDETDRLLGHARVQPVYRRFG